ncbi:hypothetical protein HMPREF7545_1505, partial [Selenomonas noxia ATCC 43541]
RVPLSIHIDVGGGKHDVKQRNARHCRCRNRMAAHLIHHAQIHEMPRQQERKERHGNHGNRQPAFDVRARDDQMQQRHRRKHGGNARNRLSRMVTRHPRPVRTRLTRRKDGLNADKEYEIQHEQQHVRDAKSAFSTVHNNSSFDRRMQIISKYSNKIGNNFQ